MLSNAPREPRTLKVIESAIDCLEHDAQQHKDRAFELQVKYADLQKTQWETGDRQRWLRLRKEAETLFAIAAGLRWAIGEDIDPDNLDVHYKEYFGTASDE